MSKGPGQLCLAQHAIGDPKRSQGARAKGFGREGLFKGNALRWAARGSPHIVINQILRSEKVEALNEEGPSLLYGCPT